MTFILETIIKNFSDFTDIVAKAQTDLEAIKAEESKTEEKEVPQTPNTTPTETVADATTGTEVFARYVKPVGTKVEVAPVEVTPMTDVVKKNRNKKKNKNGKKD